MRTLLFCVDGFTFRRINDFYRDEHPRRARLHPGGFKPWVRREAARLLGWPPDTAQLSLDCHFYHPFEDPRSRLGLAANVSGALRFEETLQEAGFAMHYSDEKDIRRLCPNMDLCDDVLLAAVYGQAEALVLFSTQGQYAPLFQRLHDLRLPTILVGWESPCRTRAGAQVPWRTDSLLKHCASHYIGLQDAVGAEAIGKDPFVEQLFLKPMLRRQMRLALTG
jgi:hypothetical protein